MAGVQKRNDVVQSEIYYPIRIGGYHVENRFWDIACVSRHGAFAVFWSEHALF